MNGEHEWTRERRPKGDAKRYRKENTNRDTTLETQTETDDSRNPNGNRKL